MCKKYLKTIKNQHYLRPFTKVLIELHIRFIEAFKQHKANCNEDRKTCHWALSADKITRYSRRMTMQCLRMYSWIEFAPSNILYQKISFAQNDTDEKIGMRLLLFRVVKGKLYDGTPQYINGIIV